MGDFNFPGINWDLETTNHLQDGNNIEDLFLNSVHKIFPYQLVNEPTHLRNSQTPTKFLFFQMKLCQITPCPYKVIVNLKILQAWFPDVINIHIKGKDVISIYNNSFRDLLSLDWSGDILKLKREPFPVDEVGLR